MSPDEMRSSSSMASVRLAIAVLVLLFSITGRAGGAPLELVQRCYSHSELCAESLATAQEVAAWLEMTIEVRAPRLDATWLADHGIIDPTAIEVRYAGQHVATIAGLRSTRALRSELESLADALATGPLPRAESLLATERAARAVPGLVVSQHLLYSKGDLVPRGQRVISGALPKPSPPSPTSYIVQLADGRGSVLAARVWEAGRVVVPPPPRPGEAADGPVSLDVVATTILLPYVPAAEEIRIYQPYGVLARRITIDRDLLVRQALAASGPPSADAELIYGKGRDEKRMVLLFLGDRYRAKQAHQKKFVRDVEKHAEFFLQEPTLGEKRQSRNLKIYRGTLTNGLDCEYNCGGIGRLICCHDGRVLEAAAASGVDFDEIIVLVNKRRYGGSGHVTVGGGGSYGYAVAYNRWRRGEWGRHVTVHEAGHSIFGLMDEYEYGTGGSIYGPNCAEWPCPWSGPDLGCFPGCSYDGLYRPTRNHCLMKTLSPDDGYRFCPVCARAVRKVSKRY